MSIASHGNIGGPETPITFSGGTLRVTGTTLTNLDSHPVNWSSFNGGFEIVDFNNLFIINQNISGSGALSKSGVGWLFLNGNNTYTGGTTISDGFLGINNSSNIGGVGSTINFTTTGFLRINGTGMTNLNNHNVNWSTFSGGFDVAHASNTFTVSQNMAGAGTLMKTGLGTLVLSGNNTYTGSTVLFAGPTIISGGTLGTASPDVPQSNIEIAPLNVGSPVATLIVNGGVVTADRVIIGGNTNNTDGATGILTQTAGTINSEMWFAVGSVGSGTFNMSGGVLNVNADGLLGAAEDAANLGRRLAARDPAETFELALG